MRRVVGGAIAVLALAAAGALLLGGALATVVKYPFAADCPPGAPSSGCVAARSAEAVHTWDDYGGDYVEGKPYDRLVKLRLDTGEVDTWLDGADADRIGLTFDRLPLPATVTMFDGEVVDVTAEGTARTRYGFMPRLAALELLGWVLLVAGFAAIRAAWRRIAAAALLGAVAAVLVAVPIGDAVTPRWVFPVLAAAYLVVVVGVSAGRRTLRPTPP